MKKLYISKQQIRLFKYFWDFQFQIYWQFFNFPYWKFMICVQNAEVTPKLKKFSVFSYILSFKTHYKTITIHKM